ncbi:MAG: FMN-binding negative transcriptional regulator [Bacteroidota bacterium]|nr:FMN-binding negative transcriptional regulator [Bacteroidota bacterium]MDP4218759.1 FMN-binding negative transcriptional regulator [Bacteroidota bacterium]MDP4252942.1 FMN-binding negative transcriptional regulator [Bacteroidota bacterium]MDP4256969.1 FMN-binding negative transcriptional regulator [Bacteroidota bacterium]
MYIPRRYEEKDKEKIFRFIREYSFGILISTKDGLPVGTHIPLLLHRNAAGEDVLTGHISRGNEQKSTLTDGATVLVIFNGPHAYVSPRWYTRLNVPTWDYIAVHVYGQIRIIQGAELKDALSRLTDNYEQHQPHPVKMDEIPEKTLDDDLRGILGFEIGIREIQAAYKLSQNRDEESYHNVITQLAAKDEMAQKIAAEMQERSADLFNPHSS